MKLLGVLYSGRSIFDVPVPTSGIVYTTPEHEWQAAARFDGLPFAAWERKPVAYKESTIAHMRVHNQMQAVLAYAAINKVKSK